MSSGRGPSVQDIKDAGGNLEGPVRKVIFGDLMSLYVELTPGKNGKCAVVCGIPVCFMWIVLIHRTGKKLHQCYSKVCQGEGKYGQR